MAGHKERRLVYSVSGKRLNEENNFPVRKWEHWKYNLKGQPAVLCNRNDPAQICMLSQENMETD